jgi:hypothetical protein
MAAQRGHDGGAQLAPGALGERHHADRVQHLVGGPQLRAGIRAVAVPAQPLAVQQMDAGPGTLVVDAVG